MKKLWYLICVMSCTLLVGCANKQVEPEIEVFSEIFEDSTSLENEETQFSNEDLQGLYEYKVIDDFINNLSSYEEQEQSYLDELQKDLTQLDMTMNAFNRFQLWDKALNEEWEILMNVLPADEKKKLREEEREWIVYKDNAVKEAGAESEGGSIQPMLEHDMAAEITKARVYELKEILVLYSKKD